jgi:hypothetical protein
MNIKTDFGSDLAKKNSKTNIQIGPESIFTCLKYIHMSEMAMEYSTG